MYGDKLCKESNNLAKTYYYCITKLQDIIA